MGHATLRYTIHNMVPKPYTIPSEPRSQRPYQGNPPVGTIATRLTPETAFSQSLCKLVTPGLKVPPRRCQNRATTNAARTHKSPRRKRGNPSEKQDSQREPKERRGRTPVEIGGDTREQRGLKPTSGLPQRRDNELTRRVKRRHRGREPYTRKTGPSPRGAQTI